MALSFRDVEGEQVVSTEGIVRLSCEDIEPPTPLQNGTYILVVHRIFDSVPERYAFKSRPYRDRLRQALLDDLGWSAPRDV